MPYLAESVPVVLIVSFLTETNRDEMNGASYSEIVSYLCGKNIVKVNIFTSWNIDKSAIQKFIENC